MSDARGHYLEQIQRDAGPLSPELAAAFAAVPREAFVPDGFLRRDGGWARPGDPDFVAAVYRDDVLVTKMNGEIPVSSSSQPSLMALMIEALAVRPGLRVLEIGAGTGYNAALLATLGASVTSIDVQPDVADRARAALAEAGVTGVRVEAADGYLGGPDLRYDRVIVTVGVSGLSPHWLDRLDDGLVVAPVEHGGYHPVLAARRCADGSVTASVVCGSGFMLAAGPLTARHAGSHPAPAGPIADVRRSAAARWDPPLDNRAYRDLQYAAGAWHRRVTHAPIRGRESSYLTLLDDAGTGGAVVLPDGSVFAAGPQGERRTAEAVAVLDRWEQLGRPALADWRVGMALDGDPDAPIWVPRTFSVPPSADRSAPRAPAG